MSKAGSSPLSDPSFAGRLWAAGRSGCPRYSQKSQEETGRGGSKVRVTSKFESTGTAVATNWEGVPWPRGHDHSPQRGRMEPWEGWRFGHPSMKTSPWRGRKRESALCQVLGLPSLQFLSDLNKRKKVGCSSEGGRVAADWPTWSRKSSLLSTHHALPISHKAIPDPLLSRPWVPAQDPALGLPAMERNAASHGCFSSGIPVMRNTLYSSG